MSDTNVHAQTAAFADLLNFNTALAPDDIQALEDNEVRNYCDVVRCFYAQCIERGHEQQQVTSACNATPSELFATF